MSQSTDERVRWTIADIELLPDNGNRYEIIDGELIVTRAPHIQHQDVGSNILIELASWSRRTKLGRASEAVGVIFTESDAVIPDVVWASNERRKHGIDE